jgi:hypothetical protein
LLAAAVLFSLVLSGCGGGGGAAASVQGQLTPEPAYLTAPFTHEQQLVEQGARLVVADGCSVCHLAKTQQRIAPSFGSFAGNHFTLANGHRVLIDERFVREALLDTHTSPIKGYDPAPMIAAVQRLHLSGKPEQVAALAAFIEQIGPETESGGP